MVKDIRIRGYDYSYHDLSCLKPESVKVSSLKGRRFSLGNHNFKYNDILKAVLDSSLDEGRKATLLKKILPLKGIGHRNRGLFKGSIVRIKRSWGRAKQKKLVARAENMLKKQEGVISGTLLERIPEELFPSIFNYLPAITPDDRESSVEKMQMLTQGRTSLNKVFGIPTHDFSKWVDVHKICPKTLPLTPEDLKSLVPELSVLNLNKTENKHEILLAANPGRVKFLSLYCSQTEQCDLEDLDKAFTRIQSFKNLKTIYINFWELPLIKFKKLLEALSHLSELRLSHMSITGEEFEECAFSHRLTHFELSGCQKFTETGVQNLKKFINLQKLTLTNCDFPLGKLRAVFPCFTHLKELCIALTPITGNGLAECGFFSTLTSLIISSFEEEGIKHIKKFKNLQMLDLSFCKLPSGRLSELFQGEAGIYPFPQLKKLIVCHSEIKGCEFENSGLHSTLTDLRLTSCKHLNELEKLTCLKRIEILSLQQSEFPLEHLTTLLSSLPQVATLDLAKTDITGMEFRHCSFAGTLKNLDLNRCKNLTLEGLHFLKQFRNLQMIKLIGCDSALIEKLKGSQILPKTTLIIS